MPPVTTPAAPRRSPESGFSLAEVVVVMVVIVIMIGVASTGVRSALVERPDSELDVASGRIWRAIADYRLDRAGRFPPAGDVRSTGLVNLSGGRYIKNWPQDPTTDRPIAVVASGARTPPPAARPLQVLYHVDAAGAAGWLAAYDGRGNVMFRRGVAPAASTAASRNDANAVVPLG